MKTKALKIAPDDVSKASLIDSLEGAYQCKILDKTTMVEYASLQVAAGEFGVLVPSHDLGFLNTLNYIFDNPDAYEERKRTTKKETKIVEPQINILAGTQPAYLAELLPETAWGMGFTSRLICVYAQSGVRPDLFALRTQDAHAKAKLTEDLTTMTNLYGEMQWTSEAQSHLVEWYQGGLEPVPQHSKLEHYNGRRILHMLKLCMISACSRNAQMVIELRDVLRAKEWLLEIERFMPDIFKAMVGRSDIDILEELHAVVWAAYSQNKQKPVARQRIWAFLQTRVPAERVQRIIDTAVGSGMLKLGDPTDPDPKSYIPGPKPNRIIE